MNKKLFWAVSLSIFCCGGSIAQPYKTNLDIRIPLLSQPVFVDGKPTLYYELMITNFGPDTISLQTLEVSDPATHSTVAAFDKSALKARFARIGSIDKNNTSDLPGGSSGILYMELVVEKDHQLIHQFRFETSGKPADPAGSLIMAPVTLPPVSPIILGSPLGDGNWAAVYDPVWRNGHRRVLYTVNGHAAIPGRYAIDFIKLDTQGRLSNGDDDIIKDWYGYGAEVLAVADGIVAATQDGFHEPSTVSGRERVSPERATGNYISLKIKDNNYAFYEHLKPGSIRVRPGQRVKKGEVIASLGFTGQSEGPHLHFHLANSNSPLGAEGLPFAFEHFSCLGRYTNIDNLGKLPWIPATRSNGQQRIKERPSSNSVIRFSSRQ